MLILYTITGRETVAGQQCGSRTLDTRVASFFKLINYHDLSIEALRASNGC